MRRIESRVAQMTARGEALRPDDNAEVLHNRLAAYRTQTEPLIAYYRRHGVLRTIDGMARFPRFPADRTGVVRGIGNGSAGHDQASAAGERSDRKKIQDFAKGSSETGASRPKTANCQASSEDPAESQNPG